MAWIVIKSAGDEYSFTSFWIDHPTGHTYGYANQMAREVTAAMKEYKAKTSCVDDNHIGPFLRTPSGAVKCDTCKKEWANENNDNILHLT